MSSDEQSRARPQTGAQQHRSVTDHTDAAHPLDLRTREGARVLIELEERLLTRLGRLQEVEWRLATAVLRRHQQAGRRAVRQIERERHRLGRELHTGVGQLLASIRVQIDLIKAQLPHPPQAVREALDRVSSLAASALEEARGISKRFYAPEWQRLSVEAAIRQLVDASGLAQRFAISLEISPLTVDPDPDIKTLIYRAAQEALSNIIRHSQATSVRLVLESSAGRLRLAVQDNGVGFDAARALSGPASGGIGLRSLREQTADLGGTVRVHSGSEGTTLEVFAPIVSEERNQKQ